MGKRETKRVADLLHWLLWFEMPGKRLEELVNMARQHDYSSVERPEYRRAAELAERLMDFED